MRFARLIHVAVFGAAALAASGTASAQNSGVAGPPHTYTPSSALPAGSGAPTSERFYLLLFTAQDAVKLPRETHTWAVMARVVDGRITETPSISWLPSDLKIKPLVLHVESGSNFSFDHTIHWTLTTTRQRIAIWGPYDADPQLYDRFTTRKTELESGAIGYQCLDFLGEAATHLNGVNCVHALTPIGSQGPGEAMQPYGHSSGLYISQTLEGRGLVAPYSPSNDWLLSALGLDRVPLDRRSEPAAVIVARPSPAAVN